jgi:CheY-like chemotaxis protein
MTADQHGSETILIVEDDPSALMAMREVLEMEGYSVLAAHDGQEALKAVAHNPPPCLILLDLMLPVMDGWELRRRIKQNPSLSNVPVIVVSALVPPRPIEAQAVLRKPVDIRQLLQMIARYC